MGHRHEPLAGPWGDVATRGADAATTRTCARGTTRGNARSGTGTPKPRTARCHPGPAERSRAGAAVVAARTGVPRRGLGVAARASCRSGTSPGHVGDSRAGTGVRARQRRISRSSDRFDAAEIGLGSAYLERQHVRAAVVLVTAVLIACVVLGDHGRRGLAL